uniref:Uncharacterized protein n=1 Tax=Nelumbo nucifera TaxID=4432 RepID=A0A822ZK76_NELNU|nr:TPA_asm: hypothetical protein HUJ06_002231 [Nelumbo nucifera]
MNQTRPKLESSKKQVVLRWKRKFLHGWLEEKFPIISGL